MEIEIVENEPCKLTVHYIADALQILNKRGEILQAFKKAPVPGFRPGKASIDAIKIHYRQQIEESLKRALAEDAYHNVLFEKKIKPHGAPKFSTLMLADGKFSCDFDLFTKPEFELAPFKDLEIPRPHSEMNENEMTEKLLQELRVRFGDVIPYGDGDFIQTGDNVILDYESTIDGVRVDNLCAEGEMLTVGASKLTVIDDNILGMAVGDTREFEFSVPEAGLPSLSGKLVHFKVTLNTGSKSIPCPLNDELANKLGQPNMTELRKFVGSAALGKIANQDRANLNEAVAVRLVAANTMSVPNWMTLSEAQYLAHQAKLEWETMADEDKEKYMEMSEKNVKLSLILDRIRETEPEAQLTDQEVFDIIKRNLSNTKLKTSLDDIIKEMNRTGYLQILFSRIRDEHALDYIVKSVKVID
jgi:trigger factor